jgi:hypothetical protein
LGIGIKGSKGTDLFAKRDSVICTYSLVQTGISPDPDDFSCRQSTASNPLPDNPDVAGL